jgi:hypothetical protein
MKFHEYALSYYSKPRQYSLNEYYKKIVCEIADGNYTKQEAQIPLAEGLYVHCKRPFYNIYPAVVECLKNTRLDFQLSALPEWAETTAINLSVGKELTLASGRKLNSLLIQYTPICFPISKVPTIRVIATAAYGSALELFSILGEGSGLISEMGDTETRQILSLTVGTILLAQDKRFMEPILLKRDQGKQLDEEGLQRAIERAKRNGRNGFNLGRGLEISPHLRKPHFAIRWTGKGSTVPRLVPIKGCVVSRNKLFPIPTGYLDSESHDH